MIQHVNQLVRVIVSSLFVFLSLATNADPRELVFLTWSEYMDPELVAEFEARYNARVRFVYFESDETRNDLLIQTDGKGYDLILVNEYALAHYLGQGWIAELDRDRIPNLRHISLRWQDGFPQYAPYAVPYFWGTVGIAYRSDLVPKPITSWMQFFKPDESMRGKIVMIKNMPDAIGLALKALGYSVNSADPKALQEAEQLLQAQKPYVRNYSYVMLNEDSALVSGEAVAAMIYSGDALMVGEHNENIKYVAPEEGTSLWIDYITIGSSSKRKDLAADFINFMNEPENAARQAEYVYYATPNKAAEALLPEEYFNNPVIYPPDEVLRKSEFYQTYPPRVLAARNRIFGRLLQ